MRRFDSQSADFESQLSQLAVAQEALDVQVDAAVADIIADVATRGDEAVLAYTAQFDQLQAKSLSELEISRGQCEAALKGIGDAQREALEAAATRVREYHERQVQDSWQYDDALGNRLGQQVTPIDRIGIYVPGGKASYPSSVLMNAIPARVAGVEDITMVVPAPGGELNELVLAAAYIAGVDRVYTIGGAQAIAALALGTNTIAAVDKIVGPGNIYVATAKRRVFGRVGIDMIAGPSEILVICDGSTNPDWIAMDLFSQAEHDENAQALLLCPDESYLDAVQESIDRLLPTLERSRVIEQSLQNRGAMILTRDLEDAITISNRLAPEHLELSMADADAWVAKVKHAGAIFVGAYSSEVLGDYCAGPSHVLPTAGSARFSSPLGVYDFQKRSSIIRCSAQGAQVLGEVASVLARGESFTAHARSAECRLEEPGSSEK